MRGIIYPVLIAAACLLLLAIYDNRKRIVNFFKKTFFSPKPIKVPKPKAEEKIDSDKQVKKENIIYGEFVPKPEPEMEEGEPYESLFSTDTIFTPEEGIEQDAGIDIDNILQEIEQERRLGRNQSYASDSLDDEILPDFENMSMADLDEMLEGGFEEGLDVGTVGFEGFAGSDGLTGTKLANAIKDLPKEIKVLIATDIFKRKF